jgi:hypothetical protein
VARKPKYKWNKDNIRELLEQSNKAVLRGILVIHSLQTDSEQASHTTHIYNGVGWTGYDAEFMSSLADQIRDKGFLTEKQMVYARKRILRYAGQLAKVANGLIPVSV